MSPLSQNELLSLLPNGDDLTKAYNDILTKLKYINIIHRELNY